MPISASIEEFNRLFLPWRSSKSVESFSMQSLKNGAYTLSKFFPGTRRHVVVVVTLLLMFSVVTYRIAVDQIEDHRILMASIFERGDHDQPHSDEYASVDLDSIADSNTSRKWQEFDDIVRRFLKSLEKKTASVLLTGVKQQGPFAAADDVEDESLWHEKNPCQAREQLLSRYESRRSVPKIKTPPELAAILDTYSRFHRVCMKASGNLTELFMSGVNSTDTGASGCNFIILEVGNGVGNRLMTLASAFLFALVTQRVILVDTRSSVPDLLCEPFSGSSWRVGPNFPFAETRTDLWRTDFAYHAELDKDPNATVTANAVRVDDGWGPVPRFYCPTEQRSYSQVRWLTVAGCLYFLPKLFVMPTFAPLLSAIFKNPAISPPLTHILRTTMLPADKVWTQVLRADNLYFKDADRQIGVHMRFRGGYGDFKEHREFVIANVEECLISNKLLPAHANGNSSGWLRRNFWPKLPRLKRTVLFVSSLYTSLFETMSKRYPQELSMSDKRSVDEVVGLVQLSHEGQQYVTLETDERALVDILCLSFSDDILTSPISTFSQVAQAWGGLQPWIVNIAPPDPKANKTEHPPPCKRGLAIGGCFQSGTVPLSCPHDHVGPWNDVDSNVAHFIRSCEDGTGGIQFLPDDW